MGAERLRFRDLLWHPIEAPRRVPKRSGISGVVTTDFELLSSASGTALLCGALSPDGRLAATGGVAQVELWEAASGRRLATLKAGRDRILSLAFSPDGSWLWAGTDSADEGRTLWRWPLAPLQEQGEGLLAHYRTSALSTHGDRLLSAGGEDDGEWILWRTPDLARVGQSGRADGEVLAAALDERGWAVLRAASGECTVEVYQKSGDLARKVPVGTGEWLAFGSDGERILVAQAGQVLPVRRDDGVQLKAITSSYVKATLKGQSFPNGDTFFGPGIRRSGSVVLHCHEGRLVAYSGKKTLWTMGGNRPLRALTQSGTRVAGCRGNTVCLWSTEGELLWTRDLEKNPVRLACDPWDRWVVALGEDLVYLRLEDGTVGHVGSENVTGTGPAGPEFASMRFAPELIFWQTSASRVWTPVAIGSDGKTAVLWDGRSLDLRGSRPGPTYTGLGLCTHAVLGEDWVVLANDSRVGRFQRDDGKLLAIHDATSAAASGLAVSADGQMAVRCHGERAEIWNLLDGTKQSISTPEPLWSCAGQAGVWLGGLSGALYRLRLPIGREDP